MTTTVAAGEPPPQTGAPPTRRSTSGAVHSEAGLLRAVVLDEGRDGAAPALADVLARRGVRMLHLVDLLADVLADPAVHRSLAGHIAMLGAPSPAVGRRIRTLLDSAVPAVAARMMLRGIPATARDLDARSPDRANHLLPPLPPARSLRQPVVAAGPRPLAALVTGREARRGVAIMSAIGRRHPLLASARPIPYRADAGPRRRDAAVDGDDVQVAPDGTVLIGTGQRTNLHGAGQVALTLLANGTRRVVVLPLPGGRLDRLDRLLAILGSRTVLLEPEALDPDLSAWVLRADTGPRLIAGVARPFSRLLPELLDGDSQICTVPRAAGASGPQRFLALGPGAVLTDAPPSDPTALLLEGHGITVEAVPDDRGRIAASGGIRRAVLPIVRDALPVRGGPTAL